MDELRVPDRSDYRIERVRAELERTLSCVMCGLRSAEPSVLALDNDGRWQTICNDCAITFLHLAPRGIVPQVQPLLSIEDEALNGQ